MITGKTIRIFIIFVSLYSVVSTKLFASQSQVQASQQSEEAEKLVDNMIGKVNRGILTENDLQEYLSKGGKIDAVNVIGYTALRVATIADRIEIVELLIAFDADVNFQNEFGISALSCAARVGNVEMVRFLLKNNADINMQDKEGRTSLMWAIIGLSNKYTIHVIQLLIKQSDLNKQDVWGWTALIYAAHESRNPSFYVSGVACAVIVVIYLLNAGADPYLCIYYDETTAAENYCNECPLLLNDAVKDKMLCLSQEKYLHRTFFDIDPELLRNPWVQKALVGCKVWRESLVLTTDIVL